MSDGELGGTTGPAGSDVSIPSPARVYDYFLGGKDNYPVDREIGDRVLAFAPDTGTVARLNRGFLVRAVDHVARTGVSQFIDLGTGIPTSPNTHEVARAVDPDARVVYVDNDPLVKAHNDARLQSDAKIVTLMADIREPQAIIDDPAVRKLIDFDRPIALMLVGLMHFITDDEDPIGIIGAYRSRMAPGSHLILSQMSSDSDPGALATLRASTQGTSSTATFRTREETTRLFEGFDLIEPGVVRVQDWRPDGPTIETGMTLDCGVGRLKTT